jgi:hypothetical protein
LFQLKGDDDLNRSTNETEAESMEASNYGTPISLQQIIKDPSVLGPDRSLFAKYENEFKLLTLQDLIFESK